MYTQKRESRKRFLLCVLPVAVSAVLLFPVGLALLHDLNAQQTTTSSPTPGSQVGFVTENTPSRVGYVTMDPVPEANSKRVGYVTMDPVPEVDPKPVDAESKTPSPPRVAYVSMEPEPEPKKKAPAPIATPPVQVVENQQNIIFPKMAPVKAPPEAPKPLPNTLPMQSTPLPAIPTPPVSLPVTPDPVPVAVPTPPTQSSLPWRPVTPDPVPVAIPTPPPSARPVTPDPVPVAIPTPPAQTSLPQITLPAAPSPANWTIPAQPRPIAPVEAPKAAPPSAIVPVTMVQEQPKNDKQPKVEILPGPVLPQPRVFPPFPPEQVRMPLLGDPGPEPLGATPRPTQKELEEYAKYIKGFIDPNNTLDLIVGRARLMLLKDTPKRIQVSDESIVGYTQFDGKEMTLLGKKGGSTVLNIWFTSADDKTKETVLSYLVRVFPDPIEKERLERVFKALEKEINKNFPNSIVRLHLVGDKVLVTGQAHDIEEASQILKIVVTNTPGASKIPSPALTPTPRPDAPDAAKGATPGADNYLTSGSPNVINMMRVAGVQQVMLKVMVAEVNRTAARSIGMNISYRNKSGIEIFENRTGGLVIPAPGLGAGVALAAAQGSGGLANIPVNLDNGQISLAINALKKMSYAKSLAEPTLVTLNGQPATFLAGGQFPIPVVTGNAIGGLQGVQFVPYGVQLQFTPFITDKDRIRLAVSATVSTRDTSTGAVVGGTAVPGLNSRNFNSTIEMRDGQTLAVAGLIQTNHGSDRDQLPFLGTIPILNRLTGFDRTSAGEQELIVLITPELVQPMHPHQLPRLPGSDLFEASDLEFYLLGRLEGRRPVDFRSPVMNDFHRIRQYNRVEQTYIFGPTGYHDIQAIPK